MIWRRHRRCLPLERATTPFVVVTWADVLPPLFHDQAFEVRHEGGGGGPGRLITVTREWRRQAHSASRSRTTKGPVAGWRPAPPEDLSSLDVPVPHLTEEVTRRRLSTSLPPPRCRSRRSWALKLVHGGCSWSSTAARGTCSVVSQGRGLGRFCGATTPYRVFAPRADACTFAHSVVELRDSSVIGMYATDDQGDEL